MEESSGMTNDWFDFTDLRHPCSAKITDETCLSRCDEMVKFLNDTPLGDFDAVSGFDFGEEVKEVTNHHLVFENRFHGRGIVMCAGGNTYLPLAFISVSQIRDLGCNLPIYIWHKDYGWGIEAPPHYQAPFLEKFKDVHFINGSEVRMHIPSRILNGWELKPYAIVNSNLREVIYIDADNIPLINLNTLFSSKDYEMTGGLFWPDRGRMDTWRPIFDLIGVDCLKEWEWESGQMVIDKSRHWKALMFTMWMNEFSDYFYGKFHGDKETFHYGWRKMGASFTMHPPMKDLTGWDCICQHDRYGRRIFQHRSGNKYGFSKENRNIRGFIGHHKFMGYLKEYKAKVLAGGPLIH